MLRLYLRDPRTQITVEAPISRDWTMNTPMTSAVWDMKEATALLAQAVAEKMDKTPMQVLFESTEAPFEIVAKWSVESDGR